MDDARPDKREPLEKRTLKKKSREAMIGTSVEVEYEENVDGKVKYLYWIKGTQEIIKVRKWIPCIGFLTKVITLKLFLDIVPSSSVDVTRAMRGYTTWLS